MADAADKDDLAAADTHLRFVAHLQQAGEHAAAGEESSEAMLKVIRAGMSTGEWTQEMLREVLDGLPDDLAPWASDWVGDIRREFLSGDETERRT